MNTTTKAVVCIAAALACFAAGVLAGRSAFTYTFDIYTVTPPVKKSELTGFETGGNPIDYVWRMNGFTCKVERGTLTGGWYPVSGREPQK